MFPFNLAHNYFASKKTLLVHHGRVSQINEKFGELPSLPSDDSKVIERLLDAYAKADIEWKQSSWAKQSFDLWDHIAQNDLKEFFETLASRDVPKTQQYLSSIGKDFVWFGGLSLGLDGYTPGLSKKQAAAIYKEKLVCLAESLGVLYIENPESGPYNENINFDANELVKRIEHKLGNSIFPPKQILYSFGLRIEDNLLHYRHINTLYAAAQMNNLSKKPMNLAEIGGGLGLCAYYSNKIYGHKYTIFDLPVSCLISGYYLIKALGHERVCLFGETANENAIQVLPFWQIEAQQPKTYDVVMNQDGLPEIDIKIVERLLQNIESKTKKYFLSLNHEVFAPNTVYNFVKDYSSMKRISRNKNWVREGYVDEIYEV